VIRGYPAGKDADYTGAYDALASSAGFGCSSERLSYGERPIAKGSARHRDGQRRVIVCARSMGWLAGLALFACCSQAAVFAQPDVRAQIEAANRRFTAAVAAANAADLAAMYTDDAMVFPPGSDVVHGRSAVQKLWQDVIDSGVKAFSLTTTTVESSADLAHETGTFVMRDAAGGVLDRGKYVVVWKRVQSQWKLHGDIWNALPPS